MSEWQPIETAPEGIEAILVWVPGANRGLDSAEVVVVSGRDDETGELLFWTNGGSNGGYDVFFDTPPTHWMPLPPPPYQKENET